MAVYLPKTLRELSGSLQSLSASGATVALQHLPKLRGSSLRLALGTADSRELRLQGEVVNVRRSPTGAALLTMRFTALDEKRRTLLQREVLRFERETIRANDGLARDVGATHAA